MALIATTAIVDSISGSNRNTVFSRNKGGAYIRGKGVTGNPNTNAQGNVRQLFTMVSQGWRGLSVPDRNSWIEGASSFPYQNRLGQTRTLTGKALYQKLNNNLVNLGLGMIDQCPAAQEIYGILGINSALVINTNASGVMSFSFAIDENIENTAFIAEATTSLSPGVTRASNQYRKIDQVLDATTTGTDNLSNLDFGAAGALYQSYVDKFGTPQVGEVVFFRVKPVNTVSGQAGQYFYTSAIVIDQA